MTFRNCTTRHGILLKWFYNVLNNIVTSKTMVIAPRMAEFNSSTNTLHSFCNKLTWSKQLFSIDFFCPVLWNIWDMDCVKLEYVIVGKVVLWSFFANMCFILLLCLSHSVVIPVIVFFSVKWQWQCYWNVLWYWCVEEAWKKEKKTSSQNSYSTVHSKAAGFHLGKKQHWNASGDDSNPSLYAYKLRLVSCTNTKHRQCWARSKHT